MSPEFGPQPPGRPEESRIDSYDLSDLRNPERQSPLLAQHMMHLAYLHVAGAGLGGSNQLLLRRGDFSFEDRGVFDLMETRVRLEISEALSSAGLKPNSPKIKVRFLHPLVAVSSIARERHMYVEVVDECCKSVLAHRGTVQVFSAGPVALHVYSPDSRQPGRLVQIQRVSQHAFKEGLVSILRDVENGRPATMFSSWAWRWVLESVQRAPEFQQELAALQHQHSSNPLRLPMKLRVAFDSPMSVRLRMQLGSLACEVALQHDGERQEPKIFTYIDSSGREAGR